MLFAGYLLAVVVGLPIGIAMGIWQRVDYAAEPIVMGLYSAPFIALYPLLIIALGIGPLTITAIVFFMTVFMIIVNTSLGVRLVSEILTRTATSFGATRRETVLKVIVPAALPAIVAGLQLGMGRALTGVVVAELFIGSSGIGYSIGYYAGTLQLADVYLGIFILGVLGVSLRALVGALEQRVSYK